MASVAGTTATKKRANMLVANISVVGTRPLLWHVFTPEALDKGRGREKEGSAGNDPTEWRRTVTYTADWQLYLKPTYCFAAICAGAKHVKKGKGSIEPTLAGCLQILDKRILVDRKLPDGLSTLPTNPEEPVYLHVEGVRNPATKARNVRYRVAASEGWKATFSIMWDKTLVSRAEVHQALVDAGALSGLGDGRKIGYGRFDLESFEVEE